MDSRYSEYLLTAEESERFERDGFFFVENALSADMVDNLVAVVDRIDGEERLRMNSEPDERINMLDFIGRDDLFLELLDWYKTFPKVWGILGWHIQLYHTHMTVTPPALPGSTLERDGLGLGWHQDSGRLNTDCETNPRPRISLKVGFFLTDTTKLNRGNFYIVPGSHLHNDLPGEGSNSTIEGALPVCVPPGTAVLFDRRLWHSASNNYWNTPRRVLFYGYSYRWLRPRDDMKVEHYLDRCDPIRKQLLGVSYSGGRGYTSPSEEDVPLKTWLEEHLGAEAVIP